MKKLIFVIITAAFLLSGCQNEQASNVPEQTEKQADIMPSKPDALALTPLSLTDVLAMQDDAAKARFEYRNPKATLEFFGVTPGMTVVEALPGGGWYSKILQPYLGSEGELIGVDYSYDLYPNLGFANEEYLEKKKQWPTQWPIDAAEWASETGAPIKAYTFSTMPEDLSADAVLFIRALHNLSRFEGNGDFLTEAIAESYRVLKPGGIVGVVQHQASEEQSDESTTGSRGYLKKSVLISKFENAGFVFVNDSDINLNPKDQPSEEDIVWRLPPGLSTSKSNEELRNEYIAIGESNRMTLLFKKP